MSRPIEDIIKEMDMVGRAIHIELQKEFHTLGYYQPVANDKIASKIAPGRSYLCTIGPDEPVPDDIAWRPRQLHNDDILVEIQYSPGVIFVNDRVFSREVELVYVRPDLIETISNLLLISWRRHEQEVDERFERLAREFRRNQDT